MPWLVTTSGSTSASAMRRTESVKTPVAFTTMRAEMRELFAGLLVARSHAVDVAVAVAQKSVAGQ